MALDDLLTVLPKHVECTWSYYGNLTSRDENTLYFITDKNLIYKGDVLYSANSNTGGGSGMQGNSKIPIVNMPASGTIAILPETRYVLDIIGNTSITLVLGEAGYVSTYYIDLVIPTRVPSITFPDNIQWVEDVTLQAGRTMCVKIEYNGRNYIGRYWFVDTVENSANNYLTIEVLEDNTAIGFTLNTIQYSTDLNTWNELAVGSTISANAGDKIYFKATGLTPVINNYGNYGIGRFNVKNRTNSTINHAFNLSGNCMSMHFGDNAASNTSLAGINYAFAQMFFQCRELRNVASGFLPATTLSEGCYYDMFRGCDNLVSTCELPATTLAFNCYSDMYESCFSLLRAPVLPATVLMPYCYRNMYYGCASLQYIKMLAVALLDNTCLMGWTTNVSPSGTFVKNKKATWAVTGANGIPNGWTIIKE